MELVQVLLDTPQLGVAEWSPVPPIKNEEHAAMIHQKTRGRDLLSIGTREHKRRRLLVHRYRGRAGWDLPGEVGHTPNEESEEKGAHHSQDRAGSLAAVVLGIAERAADAGGEQSATDHEQQIIRPRNIAGDGEHRENRYIAHERGNDDRKSNPDENVATKLHGTSVSQIGKKYITARRGAVC